MGALLPQSKLMDFSEVPVVDLGPLMSGVHEKESIRAIDRACSDVGFMYVKNHGVPQDAVDDMVRQTALFFELPAELKEDASMAHSDQFRGWLGMKEGGTKSAVNHREGYIIREERPRRADRPLDGANLWPSAAPAFRRAMERYLLETDKLSRKMLEGFSLALGLGRGDLSKMFTEATSQLKLNYYPAQERPEDEREIGLVAHTDSGAFTILWQDNVGGLETINGNGEWVVIPPIAGTFVINIGDMMQIWSNGKFSSTPHRVINRYGTNRYSIPLFVNPNYDTQVKPLIGTIDKAYAPMHSGEYQWDVYTRLYPRKEA